MLKEGKYYDIQNKGYKNRLHVDFPDIIANSRTYNHVRKLFV